MDYETYTAWKEAYAILEVGDSIKAMPKNEEEYLTRVAENRKKGAIKMENDVVNNPKHYTSGKYEVIDILQDQLTPEQFKGFLKGNIFKYVARSELKNGKEDLEKARWYLNKLIENT